MRRPLLLALALVLVAPTVNAKPPNASEVAARTELFEMINTRRADKTLPELVEDAFIDREAYLHSKAMWRSGTLSHAGYRKRVRSIEDHDADLTVLCENVASAHGITSAKRAARGVFRFWRGSPGHRRCMDEPTANAAGIGVQRSASNWYFTLIVAEDSAP